MFKMKNFCIKFIKKAAVNMHPEEDMFEYIECEYPILGDNEVIIKTLYLSVDPIQKRQMEDSPNDMLEPYQLGMTVPGLGGVGLIEQTSTDDFKVGDIVVNIFGRGTWPWQVYFKASDAKEKYVIVLSSDPKLEMTYFGIPGLTAFLGVQEMGHIQNDNGHGKCFVVSGAAGSVGHLAGQFALANSCSKVVGICGSDDKCTVLTEKLKFTGAINYKTENVTESLQRLCPDGIDVYFDNVGGDISDAVISRMKRNSHIVLCGQISQMTPRHSELLKSTLERMNITRKPYCFINYAEKFEQARQELRTLHNQGKIQILDTVYEGLEQTGKAFCDMFKGKNIGKQIVHIIE